MDRSRIGTLLCGLVVWVSLCLPGAWSQNYGVSSYQPQYPAPSYPKPQYYEKPTYYETYDVQVDYKEANQSRHCGVLPTVHRQYGYDKERVAFGEYPWQVAILDTYYNYKCAGGLLSPRHVITSAYCVDSLNEDQIKVRVGEWDLQSDKNYEEVYKNYELTVCKKHPFYYVPQQYPPSYNGAPPPQASYDYQASYPVVILELSEDVDLDQYPQVEPLCVPEFYYLSKSYTNEYTAPNYSYGYGQQGQAQSQQGSSQSKQDKNEEAADKDLECWVLGYQESPVEKIEYQSSTPYKPASYSYGESYNPSYSYESYEYSRTPRRAKVRKVESYQPNYPQSYGYSPESDSWEAEYYYDACHADLGAPIFCLVLPKIEQEEYYPAYPVSYPESYAPPAYNPPAYNPPAYNPPAYTPPAYNPPAYTPPAYNPPAYAPPAYSPPRYRRQANYYNPPAYNPPAYNPPAYAPPAYNPPAYNPAPYYEEYYPKYPIKVAERLNRETRRAVLYGVVQYPTQCTYAYGQEGNKIKATPAKDLVAWIENVLHTPASQCGYQQPYYAPPAYNPPAYNPPAYTPPSYSPPPYVAPSYNPPPY